MLENDGEVGFERIYNIFIDFTMSGGAAGISGGNVPVEIDEAASGELFDKIAHDMGAAVIFGADEIRTAAGKAS